ncbi:MAG: glycosyltransferase [Chloroflexi bacterium]|nr:glycosyltransferase [Chloroflexota bacterium]
MSQTTVAVIIPAYRGNEDLRRCLASVSQARPPPDEWIVVLDGGDEAAKEIALALGAQVAQTPTRGGPAKARNFGARLAKSDILLFVDADVIIPPDAIAQVLDAFQCEPELVGVFGSYDDAPGQPNFLSQYKNLLHHYVHQTSQEEASTFWTGCGAIRRDIFLAMGGFAEHYRQPSIEDIELGYRLKQAGYRIRLRKSLQAKHLKRWDSVSLLQSDFFARALPWSALILQSRGFINDLNVNITSRISVVLTYALLASAIVAWRWPALWIATLCCAIALLALNASLYRFFWRKRGLLFALAAIPWHWLYYLYSGLAFALALIYHWMPRRHNEKQASETKVPLKEEETPR